MRKEYVVYEKNLSINMELLDIRNYPLAWQDSTRIFFLLEGSLIINIGNESFNLQPKELEIVNKGEIYSIQAQEENKVLVLDIGPNFFPQYLDGVENIYYYTDSLDGSPQSDYKYRKLREYIAILYYEFIHREDNYEEKIEETLLETMYHLLNNFHHLYYEEESLREDELQFERFSRIINYLRENYNERVSLSEIAEKEYLTSQYLSYKIKDTFGQSFNDFLNQIRVEESRKLLLDTDKSISEIALESGFSHSRYYNKHFKNIYGSSPLKYRQIHKKTREEIEAEKEVYHLDLEDAFDHMKPYLLNYQAYYSSKGIVRRRLDLESDSLVRRKKLDSLILDDIFLILEDEYRREVKEIKERLGIKYFLLDQDALLDLVRDGSLLVNRRRIQRALSAFEEVGVSLLVRIKNKQEMEKLRLSFLDLGLEDQFKFVLDEEILKSYHILEDSWPVNDSLEINAYLIASLFFEDKPFLPSLLDSYDSGQIVVNENFQSSGGLLTLTGLRKPIYYGFFMVNAMGEDLIHKEEGLIMTRSEDSFQILIYDPARERRGEIYKNRRISLNLTGLREDYIMAKYELNRENGSIYDSWKDLASPNRLDDGYFYDLRDLVRPVVSHRSIKKVNVFNLVHSLKDGELVLYEFKKKSPSLYFFNKMEN